MPWHQALRARHFAPDEGRLAFNTPFLPPWKWKESSSHIQTTANAITTMEDLRTIAEGVSRALATTATAAPATPLTTFATSTTSIPSTTWGVPAITTPFVFPQNMECVKLWEVTHPENMENEDIHVYITSEIGRASCRERV